MNDKYMDMEHDEMLKRITDLEIRQVELVVQMGDVFKALHIIQNIISQNNESLMVIARSIKVQGHA